MAVSKRTRFEVLKRDDFTCRYCRSRTNELTIDHVVPVSLGGSDSPDNLVTACRDCNAGKASASPDDTVAADVSADALRWSRAMAHAADVARRKAESDEVLIDSFVECWQGTMSPWAYLPDRVEVRETVLRFDALGVTPALLTDAIRITAGADKVSDRMRWKYFCGVCWTKLRKLQESARALIENGEVE